MNFKIYDDEYPSEDATPKKRSTSVDYWKKAISYFMPNSYAWVEVAGAPGHGNPTKSKIVQKILTDLQKKEVMGIGKETSQRRPFLFSEYEKVLELFRKAKDITIKHRNPLVMLYQWHFITRPDDCFNFLISDPRSHPHWDFVLRQQVRWSKNIKDTRNCPDQIIFGSMNPLWCIVVSIALWLEIFLGKFPDAVMLFSEKTPPPKRNKQLHNKFVKSLIHTYRTQLIHYALSAESFKSIYKGDDKRPVGAYSCRKAASSYAKRCGMPGSKIDHRGRWMPSGKKAGNRVVSGVYIDPEEEANDADVACTLCIGGPIKYKLDPSLESEITTDWLIANVVPNIGRRYSNDPTFVRILGTALLCVCMDDDHFGLDVPAAIVARAEAAYGDIQTENKPGQPVLRVPIFCYQFQDTLVIQESIPTRNDTNQTQQ